MKRVLVYGMTDNLGGMETFMQSYIRGMQDNNIVFDFIAPYEKIAIEQEVIALGGKVYHLPSRKKSFFEYHRRFKEYMQEHATEYDAVWLNDCMFCNLDLLKFAKKFGIKTRIIHAHNSEAMGSKSQLVRHTINKNFVAKYATDFWACSDLAAEWSYPNSVKENKNYRVIPNAINTFNYRYREDVRCKMRKDLGLEDNFVIGNVGRLHFQKNQDFMIEIFRELIKKKPNAVLLLIGSGEDEKRLKEKVSTYGLEDNIHFLGLRTDVPDLLQAMDVFLMPSRFEGLGIVAIEAQTAGLPCIMSDVIPHETKVTENAVYLSLGTSAEQWSKQIEKFYDFKRKDECTSVIEHGFDIKVASQKLFAWFESI